MDHCSRIATTTTTTTTIPNSEALSDPTSTSAAAVLITKTPSRLLNPNSYGRTIVGGGVTGEGGEGEGQNCAASSIPSQQHPSDSIYHLFDKSKLTVPDFESTGLLFAKSSEDKFNL